MDALTHSWLIIDIATFCIVLGAQFRNWMPGFLQDIMVYGKARQHKNKKNLHWFREFLLVPNRWFIHFYALGLIWNIFLLAMSLQSVIKEDTSFPSMLGIDATTSSSKVDCFSVLLTLVLLTFQLIRRLCECLFVSAFSGKMHIGHYVLGLVYYFLVNLTVAAEIPLSLPSRQLCLRPSQLSWLHCVAVPFFFWACYHQYQCHTILGKLTSWTPDGKKIYKVPHGDWFDHVSSPHYLAEILIYIALFAAMRGQSFRWILVLIFVVLNLTLGAQNTHLWYKEKFDDYPKRRYIIFPYVY